MTKQISLCNQLQTAFVCRCRVPLPETNHHSVSRRWEQCPENNDCSSLPAITPCFDSPYLRDAIPSQSASIGILYFQWCVDGDFRKKVS